jgi:glycosyltransferase involved in cell wall biosynthesis
MKKILTFATSYPRYEGDVIAPFIEHITREIARNGAAIDMVLPYHPLFKKPDEKNIKFHLFKYAKKPENNIWGYASSMKADVKLKKTVLFLAPFVYKSSLNLARSLAASNHYNLIHAHWLLPNGYIAYKISKETGIPYAVSLHGSDVTMAERPLFKSFAKKVLKNASWISACSEDLRHRVINLGADPAKVTTIPYGVDVEKFKPDTRRKAKCRELIRLKYRRGQKVILAVGRLVEKKGFTYLLDAMKIVLSKTDKALLVIAGDGDLKSELSSKTHRLGISTHVYFPGNIERDDLPLYFSGCEIMVVPSVRDKYGNIDGLPNVLMEGLASGRALVASDIAGIPNVIFDGENGLLTEPENPESIAGALLRLLEDDALRKKLGSEARLQALHKYTWRHTGDKYWLGLSSLIS